MTAAIDAAFVEQVRAALSGRIRSITAEVADGERPDLQHRDLAERVKALVAARCGAADAAGDADLLRYALRLVGLLRGRQGAGGLFRGGDNVDSPPDSAFSINDLADALLILRRAGDDHPDARCLAAALEDVLTAATPALAQGGVHTPNHRWEIAAALARLHRLAPQPALADRVDQWLAEGIDLEDGLYSERSAIYAAYVSNPSLLTVAEVFGRSDLVDAVEQNLTATLDLLLPDGSVETVLSRRQDQRWPVPLAGFLLPLRRVALLRGRGDLAWAAGLALAQGIDSPASAAAALLLDPGIMATLPAAVAPAPMRRRVFPGAGLLVEHRPATTAVVFGGSDYPRHRRIRSGLANSPTFLRLFAGAAVLDSVRLSRTFFGLGPFRADGLAVRADPDGETAAFLTETVTAAYYQPLAPSDRDARGRYRLGDDGRFSAAMDFAVRERDEIALATSVRVVLTETGAALTVDVEGAAVDWVLEFAFRPGGTMSGARALGDGRGWQLDVPSAPSADSATACYRVDADALCVSVVEASDGAGGGLPVATGGPVYHPGEDYEFLGGSDAANGELLYLAARSPAHIRLDVRPLWTDSSAGQAVPPG